MSDGRRNNKGNKGNKGGGRKPKAEEQQIIELLSPLAPIALKALKNGLEADQSWAVKMYFEYVYGKAKETKDINIKEVPIIDMSEWK